MLQSMGSQGVRQDLVSEQQQEPPLSHEDAYVAFIREVMAD